MFVSIEVENIILSRPVCSEFYMTFSFFNNQLCYSKGMKMRVFQKGVLYFFHLTIGEWAFTQCRG